MGTRASRGAKLLDEKRPGWAGEIDLGELEMDNAAQCVLGQVYNSYGMGLNAVLPDIKIDQVAQIEFYGFAVDMVNKKIAMVDKAFARLNRQWRQEVGFRVAVSES